MRTTAASATLLLLGLGAANIGAKSNIHILGTDAMYDLITGTLDGIPATGLLPPIAACPGTAGLVFDGTNSVNGANAMKRGDQEAAPMTVALTDSQACTGLTGIRLPSLGKGAENVVIVGFGASFNIAGDPTGNGVSGGSCTWAIA